MAIRPGLRVLVVEDEKLVLLLIEDMLETLGCEVAATASDLASALEGAEGRAIDAAVLDVDIGGRPVYPVADALRRRNVPFVFCTGYGRAGIDPAWRSYPVVQKPFAPEDLEAALSEAVPG